MVLLLAGGLRVFWSYYLTMNSIRVNLAELKAAGELETALGQLGPAENLAAVLEEPERLQQRVQSARQKILEYEMLLREARERPTGVEAAAQNQVLHKVKAELEELAATAEKFHEPRVNGPGGNRAEGLLLAGLRGQLGRLEAAASGLRQGVRGELDSTLNESRRLYQVGLWILIPSCGLGLLLMAGILRYFHGWILNPIGELEAGVGKVAQGDFNHQIEVKSGDEMEALGEAFNDMTRRLREFYADLARQVNERSRQLVRSERLASVGFLAAGVAHEINNPLAGIAFCGEALESRLQELRSLAADWTEEQDPPCLADFSKYLRMIQEEASRCKKITEKLLDFSRTGEKKRESASLEKVVEGVLDVTRHLQNSRGKTIRVEAIEPVSAWVNTEEIRGVVLNLVVNALDSMDEGGELAITLRAVEGQAELQFADTGCGMSQEVLENIFEPFYTRNRAGKGTGLGLTISHRAIQQHGGEIEAQSAGPGKGSVFIVRLPLHPLSQAKEFHGTIEQGDRALALSA